MQQYSNSKTHKTEAESHPSIRKRMQLCSVNRTDKKQVILAAMALTTSVFHGSDEIKARLQLIPDLMADHFKVWEQNMYNFRTIAGWKNVICGQNSK